MTHAQTLASRFRWILLIAAVLCWLAGAAFLFYPVYPGVDNTDNSSRPQLWGLQGVGGWFCNSEGWYCVVIAAYFGLFLLAQWFFLGPRGAWRIKLNDSGRPLSTSILVAALAAALLSIGLLASITQWTGTWVRIVGNPQTNDYNQIDLRYWPVLIAVAVSWLIWSVLFALYWKSANRSTQFSRMLRGLFAGSILELLVSTPVHVAVLRNKDDSECYCATGSYTGLVLGGTVLLWTFGPGLALLFLKEKQRRPPLLTPS